MKQGTPCCWHGPPWWWWWWQCDWWCVMAVERLALTQQASKLNLSTCPSACYLYKGFTQSTSTPPVVTVKLLFFLLHLLLLLFNTSNSLEVSIATSVEWEADEWGCQQGRGREDGGNKDRVPSFQLFLAQCGGPYRQPKNKEEPPQGCSI